MRRVWAEWTLDKYGEFYKRFFVWIVVCNDLWNAKTSFPRKPPIQFARSIVVFGCLCFNCQAGSCLCSMASC